MYSVVVVVDVFSGRAQSVYMECQCKRHTHYLSAIHKFLENYSVSLFVHVCVFVCVCMFVHTRYFNWFEFLYGHILNS